MQSPGAAGGDGGMLQVLTFVFSGSTCLVGLRLIFQAGQLVQRVNDHERRLDKLEAITDESN